MTSIYGTDPSWILNYRKTIPTLQRPNRGLDTNKFTISGLLQNNEDFSIFNFLVRRAKLECIFDQYVTDLTVFVPSDSSLRQIYDDSLWVSIDYLAAKNIVLAHILERKVTKEMLMSSEGLRHTTKHHVGPYCSFISSYNPQNQNIVLNSNAKVVDSNMMINNGIIHTLDNLIFSPDCSIN